MNRRIKLEVVTSCEGCGGSCCYGMGGTPIGWYLGAVRNGDPNKLPPTLRAEMATILKDWLDNDTWLPDDAPCVWLDQATGLCRHYEHRPGVCRDFEVGSTDCIRRRAEMGKAPRYRMVRGKLVRVAKGKS